MGETAIFVVGGKSDSDYYNLLNAARKAVQHGYRVFVRPSVILSIFLNPSPIAIIVMQLPARSCTPLGNVSNWFMSVMP